MKKLLLVSAIVFGSVSIASAQQAVAQQAADVAQPQQDRPASKMSAKKQQEMAAVNATTSVRTQPTNTFSTGATQKVVARKAKPAAVAAKKN